MYDAVDIDTGKGTNRASVHHVMQLIEDKELVGEFAKAARGWIPQIPRMEETNARSAVRSILRSKVRYRRLVSGAEGQMWLSEIRKFRDRYVAHSLFEMNDEVKLLYGYIGDLLDVTGTILEPVRLGVEGSHWDIREFREVDVQNADTFWAVVERGMAVTQDFESRP